MHIRFADVDEKFIKNTVEQGFYASETELVRDAVRKMREEKERIARFHAAVMKGEQDIQAGRTTPLTPELMQQLMQEGFDAAKAGKPYHSQGAVPNDET